MSTHVTVLEHWDDILNSFPAAQRDLYFMEDYARLYGDVRSQALCFVFQKDKDNFILPFMKRRVSILKEEVYDAETAYGYGGPLSTTEDPVFLAEAWAAFAKACAEQKIMACFFRFHPVLDNVRYLSPASPVKVSYDRHTVAMDLTLSEDEIWEKELHPKHRNKIRMARNKGLEFVVDETWEQLPAFMEIYKQRMMDIHADEFYMFGEDYFRRMAATFRSRGFLGLVYLNEKPIAASIFLYDGIYGHYHLSGSLQEYLDQRPNNYLVYEAALVLKSKGVRYFHLGGGVTADPQDSLYEFKSRFASTTRDFHIGKLIVDKTAYDRACQAWDNNCPQDRFRNYFLKYRYTAKENAHV